MTDRLLAGIRKTAPYIEAKRICKQNGLSLSIVGAKGRGHPKAIIEGGGKKLVRPLSASPGHVRPLDVRKRLAAELRRAGFDIA